MKKVYRVVMLLTIALLTGCTHIEQTPFPTFADVAVTEETDEIQDEELTEKGLKMFFATYFSLTEEDILALNQKPPLINSTYWDTYKVYKDKLINLIGDYLTDSAKKKLKEEYMTYDFHLPKKLQINGYVTLGSALVEETHITDSRLAGENIIYQVAVTTRNQVEPISEANRKYEWDRDKAYYVKVQDGLQNKNTFSDNTEIQQKMDASYLYLQAASKEKNDEIKLIHYYWVEIEPGDKLQIASIKEAVPIQVSQDTRQIAENTKHIDRIPYFKEVSAREQSIIKKVMIKMMTQPKDFYAYYEKAFNTGYDVFKLVWQKDLELENETFLSETSYKDAFNITINPYKDTVKTLEDSTKLIIVPSVYATKEQPRFIVTVPVKANLSNNQVAYYHYKYYVGMEQYKIEFIQFMNRETLTEETYLAEGVTAE